MFKLSGHLRLQFTAGGIGSLCSLILFAVRFEWKWGMGCKIIGFVLKSTWFIIVMVELRDISRNNRLVVEQTEEEKGDVDDYANEMELLEL